MRHRGLSLLAVIVTAVLIGCGPGGGGAAPSTSQPVQKPATAAQPAQQPAQPPAAPAQPAAKPATAPTAASTAPAPASASGSTEKRRLTFGSSSPGSSFYVFSVALVKLWNDKVPGIDVTNVATGGCNEDLKRIETNELQAGTSCPEVIYQAMHSLNAWKGQQFKNQRFMFMFGVGPDAFAVGKDTGIKSLQDLNGKDFIPGMKGSGTEQVARAAIDALGLKPKMRAGGIEEIVQAYQSKQIVGFVKLQPSVKNADAATLEANTSRPLIMLPFSADDEAKIKGKYPYYNAFVDVEANALGPRLPAEKVHTIAQAVGVAVNAQLPEDLVYQLTKISIEGKNELAAAYPAVKDADFTKWTFDYVTTPLHAGAYKYFKELGKQIPDQLKPPEIK